MLPKKLPSLGTPLVVLFMLTGCQTHEFRQAGISDEQRDADSKKCFAEAREVIVEQKPPPGATSDQIIVGSALSGFAQGKAMAKYRGECMVRLGYKSEKLD
jgi:hypothetical protein